MRRFGGLLVLIVLIAVVSDAHAQFFNPYGVGGGGFQFSYSRGGPGRGLRLGGAVNFGPPPAFFVGPPIPFAGPYFVPRYNPPITVVNYVTPPPIVMMPPAPPEPLPPQGLPRFMEPPVVRPPVVKKDDAKPMKPPAELPKPEAPKAHPADEYDRQVRLGQEAFQAEEYGRSAQRFRQATVLQPDVGQAYFLLAQSLIAMGKYHEAYDAIVAGLERKPDWPTSGFRPVEMYEVQAEYPEHLRTLEEALARHPRDPELLFVAGYALWFDGRRDEAGRLFQRALARAKDRGPIERFLAALPAGEKL